MNRATTRRAAARLLAVLALAGPALAACMPQSNPPATLDLSLSRPTLSGKYVVELQPPAGPLPVNRIHTWRIALRTAAGEPVQGATIEVSGGMPEHGHGFPTQPRVSPQPEPGRYLLEGMKFSMTGWWEIKLSVRSPLGTDEVTFNAVLPASAS
ncbi:MAG TPA: FixH family protein [Albitalea sp.]|nr:FixH family protein [Albitalea sp.]